MTEQKDLRSALEACPFCKHAPYDVPQTCFHSDGVRAHRYRVLCPNCGTQSPEYDTPDEAVGGWNGGVAYVPVQAVRASDTIGSGGGEAVAKLQEELAQTLEELIDHNGDSMDDARQKRVDQLRERHWSDCAVHNEPAMPNGPCDCGGYIVSLATPARTDDAAQAGGDVAAMREAAQFLIDRLSELEWSDDGYADVMRDYFGHVEPAIGRLKSAIRALPAQEIDHRMLVQEVEPDKDAPNG